METRFAAGLWRLADPKISLASMASILLGTCAAAADGPIHWGWLAATIVGIFAIEVGKNASGEVFDFDSGADLAVAESDRSPFSGGKRVMVDGLLTRRQTWLIAAASYAVGAAIGLLIALWREPSVLGLGLVGVACAFLYHAPPARLSYRGLGELAVALCYGPLICAGAYLVQRGQVTAPVLWLSLPLGLLIGAFLWINEFPDYLADRTSGKNNLVVCLGRPRASRAFAVILALALVALLFQPAVGVSPRVWLAAAAVPPGFSAARRLMAHPESTPEIIPAQARTLLAFVLYAIGGGVGLLLG